MKKTTEIAVAMSFERCCVADLTDILDKSNQAEKLAILRIFCLTGLTV